MTLTEAVPNTPYTLTLKDPNGIKDEVSITPDKSTINLNYSPPPGITIDTNDQICSSRCFPIPPPDSSGVSSITIPLS
jgi:hypothetical protein